MSRNLNTARAQLEQNAQTPPLPANARRIIELAYDDFVDIEELAVVLSQDPAIAARLISLANSAFFSPPAPIMDVESAIVKVLGLDLARGVAVGMASTAQLSLGECPAFDVSRFWFRAVASSGVSRLLVSAAGREELVAQTGLSALLQDIGLLVAVANWPRQMQAIFSNPGRPLSEAMLDCLGFNHRELALAMLDLWELPCQLVHALRTLYVEDALRDPTAAAVWVADRWIELSDPASVDEEVADYWLDRLMRSGMPLQALPNPGRHIDEAREAAGLMVGQ